MFNSFIRKIKEGGQPLVPISEIINVTKASFASIDSIKNNKWIKI